MQSNTTKNSLNQLLNVSYLITPENKSMENGTYHDYNRLNNLTGKEWIKFQKSWFIVNPKPRQKNLLFHPAKFPEELVENFIRFFTKEGQTVIDPMVGTGSTIISAMNTGRNAIGIELLEKYSNIAAERIQKTIHDRKSENHIRKGTVKLYNGDARLLNGLDIKDIDYCITSPPYWNILHEKGFETQKKRKENNYDVYYSKDTKDVGNIEDYTFFLNELKDIYQKIHNILKKGGYLTIIVKNIKKGGKIYPLAWDLTKKLDFFTLKDEKIWCQDNVKLAPYGYGYAWVSNTVHNYCLIFKKE